MAGNRLVEPVINYYSLAWLGRHLKGRLVPDSNDDVVTQQGRGAHAERVYRQAEPRTRSLA